MHLASSAYNDAEDSMEVSQKIFVEGVTSAISIG